MPAEQNLMDHLYIKIEGSDLTIQAMDDLIEVTVDTNLHLPDMFTIHLHDEQLTWLEEDLFVLGREVEISALPEEGGQSQVLIKGEITALEPDFGDGTHASLLVRGYDRSHRLHRGTRSQAYLQVTDSDLAEKVAQEAQLRTEVDATTEVYDHVLQYNQTAMQFLADRAQRIGYEFYVQDKTLHFRQPDPEGSPLQLEWGDQLRQFRPSLTLVEQVDEVVVKGWDPKTRQVIVGQAEQGQAEPEAGQSQPGGQMAAEAFKSARRVVVNRPVGSQAEADAVAQAICDEISGAFIEAEGECYGQPELRAGKVVDLTALGRKFSGTYYVTAAQHIYRADTGYLTTFEVRGRRGGTLYGLLTQTQTTSAPLMAGPVVGIITNNKDPEGQGRVKVKFPCLSDEVESSWARLVGLGSGPERGFYCLPEINDEVLVIFENGDANQPYVIGGLWNGQDKPPLSNDKALENGKVTQRVFKTRAGHSLTFTDETEAGIILETAGGHQLTLADEQDKVILETKGGVILTVDEKITLEAKDTVKLESKKAMTIEAKGDLKLKGTNLELEASGQMKLKGTKVDINNGALEVT